jgi:hypothetical protein
LYYGFEAVYDKVDINIEHVPYNDYGESGEETNIDKIDEPVKDVETTNAIQTRESLIFCGAFDPNSVSVLTDIQALS